MLHILSAWPCITELTLANSKNISDHKNGYCTPNVKHQEAREFAETSSNLKRDEVPTLFWEPGIITGYRAVNQPWSYYFKSLFRLHNETGNVWTHLFAPVVYLVLVYRFGYDLDYQNDSNTWGILILGVTSVFSGFGSAAAHLLHSRSELVHYVMFSIDYMCVALYGYGFGIMLYYSSGNEIFYTTLGSVFPILHIICASNITLCNSLARVLFGHRQCLNRKILQAGSAAVSILCCEIIPIFRLYSCWKNNTWATDTIMYHVPYHVFTITNGILFSKHQPERAFPGKFDIFGHGHQWFHISVIFCVVFQFHACYTDLHSIPRSVLLLSQPDWMTMWTSLGFVVMLNIGLILYFYPKFKKCSKCD